MASYALIPILAGFEFDMPKKYIGFKPYIKDKFNAIWSIDGAWGEFILDENKVTVTITEGKLLLSAFGLKFSNTVSSLKIDGKSVDFKFENGIIYFEETTISQNMEFII